MEHLERLLPKDGTSWLGQRLMQDVQSHTHAKWATWQKMGHLDRLLPKDGISWLVQGPNYTQDVQSHTQNGPPDERWDSLTGCCTSKDVTFWLAQRLNEKKMPSQWVMDILWWTGNNLFVLSLYFTMGAMASFSTHASRSTGPIVFSIHVPILKAMELKALGLRDYTHDYICVPKWYGFSQKDGNFTNLKLT